MVRAVYLFFLVFLFFLLCERQSFNAQERPLHSTLPSIPAAFSLHGGLQIDPLVPSNWGDNWTIDFLPKTLLSDPNLKLDLLMPSNWEDNWTINFLPQTLPSDPNQNQREGIIPTDWPIRHFQVTQILERKGSNLGSTEIAQEPPESDEGGGKGNGRLHGKIGGARISGRKPANPG